MAHWLVKTDPETYSIEDFKKEKNTSWDGIRNYAARNFLRDMKVGDKVLVYHSGGESAVVGTAVVSKAHYKDPTSDDPSWLSVGLKFESVFKKFITLREIKTEKRLAEMVLLKISRLSVMPVTVKEYETILKMTGK